ncbi:N-formylglutamate amidohydrolase [Aureimonas flava]|uniref:N-formylglutamate amidohydrolase n=2 Tax=Aureimonas flava TaxID=2320271 RepID=A0A3A1WTQ4_9HYPH|nr:N-formylglutamate amidohydrolase [Aureimonas flava]
MVPRTDPVPVLLDSPHSGNRHPADWRHAAPREALLTAWDAYVDELFNAAPDHGAALLRAFFPRTFIDLNRARDDVDPDLLEGQMSFPAKPGRKSGKGFGLLRRYALPGIPVYDRLLPAADVERWIRVYYDPYHAALRRSLDVLHDRFGFVWHIDCHSMKSVGNAMNDDAGRPRADFVVSDRDGTSADPALTRWIAELFRERGYSATVNDPYKGAELIAAYGDPSRNRHSIQIEVNRALYLDEAAFEKGPRFETIRADIGAVLERIAQRARSEIGVS